MDWARTQLSGCCLEHPIDAIRCGACPISRGPARPARFGNRTSIHELHSKQSATKIGWAWQFGSAFFINNITHPRLSEVSQDRIASTGCRFDIYLPDPSILFIQRTIHCQIPSTRTHTHTQMHPRTPPDLILEQACCVLGCAGAFIPRPAAVARERPGTAHDRLDRRRSNTANPVDRATHRVLQQCAALPSDGQVSCKAVCCHSLPFELKKGDIHGKFKFFVLQHM